MNVKEWTLHDGMRRRLSILLMMMNVDDDVDDHSMKILAITG